jgi:hypothetical protein
MAPGVSLAEDRTERADAYVLDYGCYVDVLTQQGRFIGPRDLATSRIPADRLVWSQRDLVDLDALRA